MCLAYPATYLSAYLPTYLPTCGRRLPGRGGARGFRPQGGRGRACQAVGEGATAGADARQLLLLLLLILFTSCGTTCTDERQILLLFTACMTTGADERQRPGAHAEGGAVRALLQDEGN